MPEIPVDAQIFDVTFHPTACVVYTGLLNGYVKAFAYDEQGGHKPIFSLRPSKKSCRGISLNLDGSKLYTVGRGKSLSVVDTSTEDVDIRTRVHEATINRVKSLTPWLLSTGDDDGVIKMWDPRKKEPVQTYTHHFDYISDFLWLEDKKHLVATSGDGTLSVMDVRANKTLPLAHSEDQEDELLSVVSIKSNTKIVVGTQLGILSIFNRNKGWNDCVDRIPGHPLSVDALCSVPTDFPHGDPLSTVLTGSSDGYVRAVEILPTKLLGVVADHGEFPVERIALGQGTSPFIIDDKTQGPSTGFVHDKVEDTAEDSLGEQTSRWWVGSAGHENVLRLTNLEAFYRDGNPINVEPLGVPVEDNDGEQEAVDESGGDGPGQISNDDDTNESDSDSDSSALSVKPPQRKRKAEKPTLPPSKKAKGKESVSVDKSFFDGL